MIVTFFVRARKIIYVAIMALGVVCMYFHSLSTFSLPKKKKKDRTPDGRLMRNGRKSVGTVRLNISPVANPIYLALASI